MSYNAKYRNSMDYPCASLRKTNPKKFEEMRDAYSEHTGELESQFMQEIEKLNFVDTLPKNVRSKIYSLAWEKGHAYGYDEVASYYSDFAELAKMSFEAGLAVLTEFGNEKAST